MTVQRARSHHATSQNPQDSETVDKADFSKREDRRNLAKCISGFANSDGGLIFSKLNELTGQAVSPIVDGIRHKAIKTAWPSINRSSAVRLSFCCPGNVNRPLRELAPAVQPLLLLDEPLLLFIRAGLQVARRVLRVH